MTLSANIIEINGSVSEKIKLPEKIFGVVGNDTLTAVAVRTYLSNKRRSPAKTKTRSEVNKTTAKMYKQKGTGRARHGAYSAPIFVGGGVSHGPTGNQNYHKKMTKNSKRLALFSALTEKAMANKIFVLSEPKKFEGKTKEVTDLIKKIAGDDKKVLIVTAIKESLIRKAFANLEKAKTATPNQLNAYLVLNSNEMLFTKEGLRETTTQFEK